MTGKQVSSIQLTEADRLTIEKAKKFIAPKGVIVTLAQTLKTALYFYVETKEAEQKTVKPNPK